MNRNIAELVQLVSPHEQEILAEWLELLNSGGALQSGRVRDSELQTQCRTFLALFLAALKDEPDLNPKAQAFESVRGMLSDISRSRAVQGFSPTETVTFVFSLKQPLFNVLTRNGDSGRNARAIWNITRLIDELGLHAMEVYQKTCAEVIARKAQEIAEISTPVVKLWDGILALPLISTLDSRRTQVVMENLLQSIVDQGAEIVQSHLQSVLASATDYAIIRMDETGHITGWFPGAVAVFGWSEAEAIGQHIDLIFSDEDRAAGIAARELKMARETGRAEDQRWHMRRDGTKLFANGVMTRLSGSPLTGFVKVLRDQTRQRQAEQTLQELNATLEARVVSRTRELEKANEKLREEIRERIYAQEQLHQSQKIESVGQLTGGIAHDFNNMLAVIISGLSLVQRRLERGDTDVTKFVDGAMESAKRAAALTQRLLAFSRQQPLRPTAIDCNRMIAGMLDLLNRTLGEAIRLETHLSDGLWTASADPNQIENVVLNLAVNARDAMTGGGTLSIETVNAHIDAAKAREFDIEIGDYILITVADTGTGMPPEIMEKAFNPFFTTKGVGKGTGLGLSQVFGFARQSGGHVKIISEVEQGTAVKVYLPRFHGNAPQKKAKPRGTDQYYGEPHEIIMVVEDEDRVRALSVEALRELGYTVVDAGSGPQALDMIEAGQNVTLLFTDMVMPDMTGRQLAELALQRIPQLKIIYTTGYMPRSPSQGRMLEPGAHFLPKPFSLEKLGLLVRDVLDEPNADGS